ncbi:uncharacterized protein SPPG_05679 [Spizellomyces punctatus DAOM BR117]|uniref:Mei2-like C-terminal RNA recognition motif domain-containing protein n=1 Tax=Spizellomyces punctatus (strain DAOM BR117) TaxID=645134 RepID=A0A0L0HF69_SPIPD|nr:uncharacterized protein SPPG_05679 [Spizellomyces punctatus DAOM BR117]KNC99438.1 hypothetical protein SPPG_05679 [Spizellomyces punctatus DAOM BR117]|eukprot:XP_016607478.1 hypothetical protein SPPG_05679 [Spizellomyces punctatus DAOM BR117]
MKRVGPMMTPTGSPVKPLANPGKENATKDGPVGENATLNPASWDGGLSKWVNTGSLKEQLPIGYTLTSNDCSTAATVGSFCLKENWSTPAASRSFAPPTPSRSPYAKSQSILSTINAESGSESDNIEYHRCPGSPMIKQHVSTPPASPLLHEYMMPPASSGQWSGSLEVIPSVAEGSKEASGRSTSAADLAMLTHEGRGEAVFWTAKKTRTLALDNLPVHMSLTEVHTLLQSFGDLRDVFRPQRGLYSGAVAMFFDLRSACNAYTVLRNSFIGGRRSLLYFVDTDALSTLMDCESYPDACLRNQGALLLTGFSYRDDDTLLRVLESHGNVRSIAFSNVGSQISYVVEYFDTRSADQALHALSNIQFQGGVLQVRFHHSSAVNRTSHSFARDYGLALPTSMWKVGSVHGRIPGHSSIDSIDLQQESKPEGKLPQPGRSRVRSHFRPRSLKIDTSPSAIRPSPLRRAASASSVSVSAILESDVDQAILQSAVAGPQCKASRLKNVAHSSPRMSPMASPKYLMDTTAVHSPASEPTSPSTPVPPPTQHAIPTGNELNLYNIAMGYDARTTFMIRNIPNKYTQQMLVYFLNKTHKGQYNFLYLRMDFKNRCNVGYAFINFTGPPAVLSFAERVVGKKWSKFNSDKVCTLSYANIQGQDALIQKFRNSSVMLEDPSYRPKIFYTAGPLCGEEEPFPEPTTAIRPRSDVLFSRDNAGTPHKHLRPDSPVPVSGATRGSVTFPRTTSSPTVAPSPFSAASSKFVPSNELDSRIDPRDNAFSCSTALGNKLSAGIYDDLDLSRLSLAGYTESEEDARGLRLTGHSTSYRGFRDQGNFEKSDFQITTDGYAPWSLP